MANFVVAARGPDAYLHSPCVEKRTPAYMVRMPRAASHTAKRPALLSVHLLQIQLQAENPFADHMEDRDLHREVHKRCAQNGLDDLPVGKIGKDPV